MVHTEHNGQVYQVVLQMANKNNLVQHALLLVKRTTISLGFCVTHHKADIQIVKEITVRTTM
jgi:hypothetical protein